MRTIVYLLVALAVVVPAGAMDQETEAWWTMAAYSMIEIGHHIDGMIFYTSAYSQYDHMMSAREAAQFALGSSMNMTVSNDSAEAKSIFEAGLVDFIIGTEYSEAIYGCGENLACQRENSKMSGVYYGNYTAAIIKMDVIFNEIALPDPGV